ncbi:unnamed protein product [Symbiodinium natans]|uniref:FH2 domain-containing protein n=1 Tax=Symbiodinium natans TaxID=878477 RepID=A0A812V5I8_9DINO|nr:unnamed protein product [Symbiodinium natans]
MSQHACITRGRLARMQIPPLGAVRSRVVRPAAFDAHFKEGIHREVSVNGEIKTRWLMSKRYMHRAGSTSLRSADEGSDDSAHPASPRELQSLKEALQASSAKFKEQLAEEEALRRRLEALQKKAAEGQPQEQKQPPEASKDAVPVLDKEKDKDKAKEDPSSPKTEPSEASPTSPSPASPGKGKGKAPGKSKAPPKGKGKGQDDAPGAAPRMPEVKPRKAMKKLYWNPLKLGNGFASTVWEFAALRFEQGGAFFDQDELENNFAEMEVP